MDVYEYKGRNKRGEIMKGTIESPSSQAVASWMMSAGIFPIHIRVQGEELKSQPSWLRRIQGRGGPLEPRDLLIFTRQMGTMVKSGVPMIEAFSSLQKSTAKPAMVDLLRDVRTHLVNGHELSGAMAKHPEFFDNYYISMVRVGESTGQLEETFKRLFEQLNFEKHMKMKIKGALRYPMFVLIAISIAIAIMALFVIPVFAKTYAKMHATLPFLTLLLLNISKFAVNYWWAVLAVILSMFYGFRLFTRLPEGRYKWDKFKLRLPVVGAILEKAALARFCRSFATASRSGVPIVQAFTLVSRVVENAFYEERILQMRDGVERGDTMLRVAQTAAIFTPLELQMISVGEDTGDIDGMLAQLADMYQEEVDYEVGRLSESIEPILLAFMGILVLVLMLGIFLPMWKLGQAAMIKH